MAPGAWSRYRFCDGLTDAQGRLYLSEPLPYGYRVLDDTIEHVALDGDTWWGLAGQYFPNLPRASELYWVIADFQPEPVIDPTLVIPAGTVLYIPSERTVREEILSEARRLAVEE